MSIVLGARSLPLAVRRAVRGPTGVDLTGMAINSFGAPGDFERDGFDDFVIAVGGQAYVYSGASAATSGMPTQTIPDVLGNAIAR
jgi:hypothetical protein